MSISGDENRFPTSLHEITFSNADVGLASSIYKTLDSLRKSTLSIPNRLRSILEDAEFVATYFSDHDEYSTYPLIANERCGSWYIPPALKGGSAYFKSTDGHHGQWTLSLRRLNLNLLEILGVKNGVILIDSTRRGKALPDALRRTVPIWVAVWNHLLFPSYARSREWHEISQDTCQRCMRRSEFQSCGLEPNEVRQIKLRMNSWTDGIRGLALDLDSLRAKAKKPIRCVWVSHGGVELLPDGWDDGRACEHCANNQEWNTLVLCSASRQVIGAEMSEDGYIQGAGDDSEGWSHGLTPLIFWQHKEALLNSHDEDLPNLIRLFIEDGHATTGMVEAIQIHPISNIFIAAGSNSGSKELRHEYGLVINCNGLQAADMGNTIALSCRTGKLGSKDLREKLFDVRLHALQALKKDSLCRVLVLCNSGRDLSVGVVLTLLCLFYNDAGQLNLESTDRTVDKQLIKRRLAWITSCKPDANPSRSTLQAVNSFLIGRPS